MTDLITAIRALFGSYVPTMVINADETFYVPDGLAGVNFEYIAAVLLFAIALVCVFKLLGVVLSAIVK